MFTMYVVKHLHSNRPHILYCIFCSWHEEAVSNIFFIKSIFRNYAKQDDFLPQLKANIAKVLGISNLKAVAEIDEKINEKQKEIIRLTKGHQNCNTLGDEIIKLRDEKYRLQLEDANREGSRLKLEELESFLSKQGTEVQEYDDALVRRLVETITVYDDRFKVKFESGIEIEVVA